MKKYLSVAALASAMPAFAAGDMGSFLLHHTVDNSKEWQIFGSVVKISLPDFQVFGIHVPTLHTLTILFAAVLSVVLVLLGARREGHLPKGRWGVAVESTVEFIRDELVVPNFGKKDSQKWFPLIATLFFFILTLNLIGLIPGFAAASGNLAFSGTLAIMIFVIFNVVGMAKNGIFGYWAGLIPSGLPKLMIVPMFFLELLNVFSKTLALGVRLFANMMAGHMMISALMAMIILFGTVGLYLSPLIVGLTVAIYVLKILIAFLQAFVFAMLSSLFIGSAIHQEH